MKRILTLAALMTAALSAHADSLTGWAPTGNDYVATCISSHDVCLAYTHGVLDGFVTGAMDNAQTRPDGSAIIKGVGCVPNGVSNGELLKVVLAYADKHPADLYKSADVLVVKAVTDAWGTTSPEHPCDR
jgi:hypothetical protein